jgi:hypothetical protein
MGLLKSEVHHEVVPASPKSILYRLQPPSLAYSRVRQVFQRRQMLEPLYVSLFAIALFSPDFLVHY